MAAPRPIGAHWLFLRGLARENAHWDDFPRLFSASMPESRIELMDLPGNGQYFAMDSPLTLESTLEFLRERVSAKADSRVRALPLAIFSMSLGSMVAIAWAQRYPEEIAGAVLINTSLGGISPLHRRLRWRSWPLVLRIASTRNLAHRERLILALTAHIRQPTDALIDARVATYRQHPVRSANVLRQLWAAARFRPPPLAPAVPLLLLNSGGDRMVDPFCSAMLASNWNAALKTHPSAGHDLPLDDPIWTVTQVSDWWKEIRTAPVE